jgi:small subunit ribosomal protein S21
VPSAGTKNFWQSTLVRAGALARPGNRWIEEERRVQVLVRDNNVDQALKVLKKKMQREGVFREMKIRRHYEKPSEQRAREKAEGIRRARKQARKKLQREGLLPMKPRVVRGAPGRPSPARSPRFWYGAATDTIQYVVTDQSGLTSTSTRTVIIEAPQPANDNQASSTPSGAANDNTPPSANTSTAATSTTN